MKLRTVRRSCIAILGAAAMVLTGCSNASHTDGSDASSMKKAEGFSITDVDGRTVEFDKAPERIILGESRNLFATAILNKEDPTEKIVAWGDDMRRNVPDYWETAIKQMPRIGEIPEIGAFSKGDVTVEKLLAQNPDVLVISRDQVKAAEKGGLMAAIDNAGIKYVVTDFRTKPLTETTKSMEIYGKLLGREKEAAEFNKEWTSTVKMIEDRTAKVEKKPTVFVWRAAGLKDCCATWKGTNIGELVDAAGGMNLGDDFLKSEAADLTPEQVIASNPDVVIATGGAWNKKTTADGKPVSYASAGYGVDPMKAEASMHTLLASQAGFELLDAPKNGQFHSIWHQFYNSPFNYLAMLQIAQWLHPDEFKDVDVQKKWMDAHERWDIMSGEGAFFNTLDPTK